MSTGGIHPTVKNHGLYAETFVIDCIKNDRAAGAAEAKKLAKKAADKKQKELLARLEPLPFEIEPPRELPEDSPFKRFERKPHAKRAASKK